MKQFFKYILIRVVTLFLILYFLDLIFTKVYTKSNLIRNKIQYIFKNNNKNFDYVFLGSSRVEFNINTPLIDSITNKKSLNLGISGQDLPETFLILKLLIENNYTIKKYFIQVDDSNFNSFKNKSFIGASYFMPYIDNLLIKNHLKKYDIDFNLDYYIPFYRYMNYSPKIGYREFLLTLGRKKRAKKFYIALHQFMKNKNANYTFNKTYNIKLLNEIKDFAKENHLNITFFTAPYFHPKKTKPYIVLAKKNNISTYIDSLQSVKNFKDVTHLNYIGARKFTKMLIRDFDLNK